jgi:hypothetical protein
MFTQIRLPDLLFLIINLSQLAVYDTAEAEFYRDSFDP